MSGKYYQRDEKYQKAKFITLQNCTGDWKERVIRTDLIESVKVIDFPEGTKFDTRNRTHVAGLTFKLSNGEEVTTMAVDISGDYYLDLYYCGDNVSVWNAFELSDILNSIIMEGHKDYHG